MGKEDHTFWQQPVVTSKNHQRSNWHQQSSWSWFFLPKIPLWQGMPFMHLNPSISTSSLVAHSVFPRCLSHVQSYVCQCIRNRELTKAAWNTQEQSDLNLRNSSTHPFESLPIYPLLSMIKKKKKKVKTIRQIVGSYRRKKNCKRFSGIMQISLY